jgi:hypothetical protein
LIKAQCWASFIPGMERKSRAARNEWGEIIPEDQWVIYKLAIQIARACQIEFMLGGAFGLAGYTGRWRNTKDLDFFVLPESKDRLIEGLLDAGFEDFYDRLPYDRGWIYRAIKDDVLVDVIWATPNRRTLVDSMWFPHATPIELRGESLHLVPMEEILWVKMYVMQKDRCDWPDLLNLLYAQIETVNWEHLYTRLGGDLPLLAGLLQVFAWMCPTRSRQIPEVIRKELGILDTSARAELDQQSRVNLLDSRPWFAALQPSDQAMQL